MSEMNFEHIKMSHSDSRLSTLFGSPPSCLSVIITLSSTDSYFFLIQISYGPFDSLLCDRVKFPSLYQMAPKDSALHQGVVRLIVYFKWNWIGLIISDDMRGEKFLWEIRGEMVKKGVCVSFAEKIPVSERTHMESHETFMPRILTSSA